MNDETMSNACYTCKHRGDLFNSRHSCCQHPRVNVLLGDHEALIYLMKGITEEGRTVVVSPPALKVEFEEQGILGGWACYPFNFDPIWLRYCNSYEEVKK